MLPYNTTDPKTDPLSGSPPQPPTNRSATGIAAQPDHAALAERAAYGLGLAGPMVLMRNMMRIQKLIEEMAPHAPMLIQVFAPALAQARDIAASSLANAAQGGLPAAETGMEPPPPGAAPPSPLDMMMGGGGGVGGMAPMPPPQG